MSAHAAGLWITVRGHSMEPALPDGEKVEVALTDGRIPRVGEVVLVLDGRALVLHRVIHAGPERVVTQGDALPRPDPPLPVSRVLGVARVKRRTVFARVRWAAEALRKPVRRHFSARRLRLARLSATPLEMGLTAKRHFIVESPR